MKQGIQSLESGVSGGGVKLEVTPVLTEDHMILVEVKPEVSSSL